MRRTSTAMRMLILAERLGRLGGMERYLELTLPALADGGHHVRTLADVWTPELDDPDPRAAAALREACAGWTPGLIVAHNIMDAGALEAARALTPRLIYHVHDHRPFCPNGDRVFPQGGAICTQRMGLACGVNALTHGCCNGLQLRTLERISRHKRLRDAIARADGVIVLSNYMRDSAARNGIASDHIAIVDPPLERQAFSAAPVPPARATVAFVGRVVPQKGLLSLVRAIARIAPAGRPRLLVAGVGPALGAACAVATAADVDLVARGALAPNDVYALVDESSCVALPSLWAEPFGLAGIEAHARGRAVAGYATGGTDAWRCSADRFVARGDEVALARAIEDLCAVEGWQQRAERTLESAQRYRPERALDGLIDYYVAVASGEGLASTNASTSTG